MCGPRCPGLNDPYRRKVHKSEKIIRENPDLMSKNRPDSQGSKYDSTINDFEEIIGKDMNPKGPRPKNKKGNMPNRPSPSGDNPWEKRRENSKGEIPRAGGNSAGDDSEDIIKNLDNMMNEYLKRKG